MELLVYMGDILLMSKSFDEGIERLARIFERLIAANLKLKHPNVLSLKCLLNS